MKVSFSKLYIVVLAFILLSFFGNEKIYTENVYANGQLNSQQTTTSVDFTTEAALAVDIQNAVDLAISKNDQHIVIKVENNITMGKNTYIKIDNIAKNLQIDFKSAKNYEITSADNTRNIIITNLNSNSLTLDFGESVTLIGGKNSSEKISGGIDATDTSNIGGTINLENATFENCSCKIANVKKDSTGGALSSVSNVNVQNCTFDNNLMCDKKGGGIYCAGNLKILNSKIINNSAGVGGGVYVSDITKLSITNSFFSGNKSMENTLFWDANDSLNKYYNLYHKNINVNSVSNGFNNAYNNEDISILLHESISVTVNPNGGTFSDGETNNVILSNIMTGTSGKSVLTYAKNIKTGGLTVSKKDYTFQGWYTDNTYATPMDFSKSITSDLKIFAKWGCTLLICNNDGTKSSSIVDMGTIINNPTANELKVDTNSGAWCDENGYVVKFPYMVSKNTVLKNESFKSSGNTFNVSFDLNNGSGDIPDTELVENGGLCSPPLKATPTRQGYTFIGWFANQNAVGNPWSFRNDEVTTDLTLYAGWSMNKYNVQFYLNDGTNNKYKSEFVDYMGIVSPLGNPSRTGYNFIGWYTSAKCDSSTYWDPFLMKVRDTIKLYAGWTKEKVYTVTFHLNEGVGVVPSDRMYVSGEKVQKPVNPVKNGYLFIGWYSDTSMWNFDSKTVSKSTDLVANWKVNSDAVTNTFSKMVDNKVLDSTSDDNINPKDSKNKLAFFVNDTNKDVLINGNKGSLNNNDGYEFSEGGNFSIVVPKNKLSEKSVFSLKTDFGTLSFKGNVQDCIKRLNSVAKANKLSENDIGVMFTFDEKEDVKPVKSETSTPLVSVGIYLVNKNGQIITTVNYLMKPISLVVKKPLVKIDNKFYGAFKYNLKDLTYSFVSATGAGDNQESENILVQRPGNYFAFENKVNFSDVNSNMWYSDYVRIATSRGLCIGVEAGKFEPESTISRGEFLVLIQNMMNFPKVSKKFNSKYSDVNSGAWFYNGVTSLEKAGILSGFNGDTISPNKQITREEMAVIVSSILKYKGIDSTPLNSELVDENDISPDYASDVQFVCGAKIMCGLPNGKFEPKSQVTRAECATILVKIQNLKP